MALVPTRRGDKPTASRQSIVAVNPFASLLEIVSEPLLGSQPSAGAYTSSISFIVVLALLALPLFARFRASIVYWL